MHCQLVKEEWLVEKNMIGKCFCNIVELIHSYMFLPSQLVILVRGPRRVHGNWDLLIFRWENEISCTGTGIHQPENNRK